MTSHKGRILIVDDEVELKHALCETLAEEGFETTGASDAAEGLALLEKRDFDLMLTDLMMPGLNGVELLRKALEIEPTLVGIIMTGQGTIPTAVEAMRIGAFDYVLKPFNLQMMLPILDRALEVRRLRLENTRLRGYVQHLNFESPRYQIIGSGPDMQKVLHLIQKTAPTDATVLIRGPSGTGKELVARALHRNSMRRDKPMVTINCAALQETLLESELFGHERGSFTGAHQSKLGLIEVAEGGTLFIDEVAEMPPSLQAKLLRVLEDGHFRRVGSIKDNFANVRIIAATNRPLEDEQKAGRFREDLYYRLNVITIDLPPLRDRRQDIPDLVEHFLTFRQIGKVRYRVEADAMRLLTEYDWPGNVRELANVIERAQILAEDETITLDDLPDSILSPSRLHTPTSSGNGISSDPLNLGQLERATVIAALEKEKGNKAKAAKRLSISRRKLYRLISKYDLVDPKPVGHLGATAPGTD